MNYSRVCRGEFLERANRFVARVAMAGAESDVHVKNTGRCRELLVPGATVYLEDFAGRMGRRHLRYDLIAVEKGSRLINMDAQAPNRVAGEALAMGIVQLPGLTELAEIKPEAQWGASRLDFRLLDQNGREGYLEVKGVTLETGGVASFPDAPTERGVRHLRELTALAHQGVPAAVLFVVQMEGCRYFEPNDEIHAAFGAALREAARAGVAVLAHQCGVTPDSMVLTTPLPVRL